VTTPHGPVVLKKAEVEMPECDRLFPLKSGNWGLPTEAELSPKAAARVARERRTQSFDNGARALNIDWGTSFDGKQIQRWGEALGRTLVGDRGQAIGIVPTRSNFHRARRTSMSCW